MNGVHTPPSPVGLCAESNFNQYLSTLINHIETSENRTGDISYHVKLLLRLCNH